MLILYRSKLISRPKYILEPNIHRITEKVPGYDRNYTVPAHVAIMGHYRNEIPHGDCVSRQTFSDKTALKFMDRLRERMCSKRNSSYGEEII